MPIELINDIMGFAWRLLDFAKEFNPYEYMDIVENAEQEVKNIVKDISDDKCESYCNELFSYIMEDVNDEASGKAYGFLRELRILRERVSDYL